MYDHTRMIVRAVHHGSHALFPVSGKSYAVVLKGLGTIPHIRQFIHHNHAVPVTGRHQLVTHGIVRKPQRIITGFFQQTDFPVLRGRKYRTPHHSMVMMHAAAIHF